MKRKNNTGKIFMYMAFILVFGLVFSSISFSYQNGSLDINGNTKVNKNSWNIYFSNLEINSNNNDDYITIDSKSTKVKLDITLNSNKNVEFTLDINNDSLYNFKLNNIILNGIEDSIKDNIVIEYKYDDGRIMNVNDSIISGESKKIRVLVKNIDKNNIYNLNFSLQFVYVQGI